MNTTLLATDGSPTASRALDFAISLCRETGARLEVMAVRTLAQHGDPEAPVSDHMDQQPVVEKIAADAVEQARAQGVQASARTAFGSPATQISETAEALGADLVVVGSHGRTGLARVALGSVSLALVSSCEVPVTVVRSVPTPTAAPVADPAHAS